MIALVLMKALPVTKGHEALINFAYDFVDPNGGVRVLMDYAPGEPAVGDRIDALARIVGIRGFGAIEAIEVEPQSPDDDPNFWGIWEEILRKYSYVDYVIGSEPYCERVAEIVGARYIPFDPNRESVYTRATDIRTDPLSHYDQMHPLFQKWYRTTVTVFGAESTGKTTLSKALAENLDYAPWLPEWARPYLETVGTDITIQSMTDIARGQYALQRGAHNRVSNSPYIVQDTDLFTTFGYWVQPHWLDTLGNPPEWLVDDAYRNISDLYLITKSNIPFEEDPLRYGGDHRESPDEYWIGMAKKFGLNYVVLDSDDRQDRLTQALNAARLVAEEKTSTLRYERPDQ